MAPFPSQNDDVDGGIVGKLVKYEWDFNPHVAVHRVTHFGSVQRHDGDFMARIPSHVDGFVKGRGQICHLLTRKRALVS